MADNIVQSMFGLSPSQIYQQRREQANQQALTLAQLDPMQRANYMIYSGSASLAQPIGRMLGMPDTQVEQAQKVQDITANVDTSTPNGYKILASKFLQAGMPQQAALASQRAMEMESIIAENELRNAKTWEAMHPQEATPQAKNLIKSTAVFGGKEYEVLLDPITGKVVSRIGEGKPLEQKTAKMVAEDEQKQEAKQKVSETIANLRSYYQDLEKNAGIVSTKEGTLPNVVAGIASSGLGQYIGSKLGTQNQSTRNKILMTRPSLMSQMMRATNMTSRAIDSNAELKLWLDTATNPNVDVQANYEALKNIENFIGLGTKEQPKPVETKTTGGWAIRPK